MLKSKYQADKTELEKKVPNVTAFAKKVKLTELENKIPDVSILATKTALTAVENKIPDVSNLVKKTDYNTIVTEIENKLNNHNHDKYIDTQKFNKLSADVFNTRLAQANLITKTDFDFKLSRKITKNKSKHSLVENELNKLKTFDLSYFIGKSHFDEDGTQNYLVFQPIIKYFKINTIIKVTNYGLSWKSKGLPSENIKPPTTSDNGITPTINYYYGTKVRGKFTGSCLKQQKISYTHSNIVNIYIVYELGASGSNNSDPTLKNCLSGAVTLSKNADIDKYGYSGYGMGFDRRSSFSFPCDGFGQNVLIFGVDISSSDHLIIRKKTY